MSKNPNVGDAAVFLYGDRKGVKGEIIKHYTFFDSYVIRTKHYGDYVCSILSFRVISCVFKTRKEG